MDIEFFKASELDGNIKATIHANGKLGFNRNAEKKLNLESVKTVKIGRTKEYEKDRNLFLITTETDDVDGFAVMKSGSYFYANTRSLFDLLGEDYENVKVIYDIVEIELNGQKIFKLKRRTLERKKGESEIEE
ncbi:hypothetical protein F5984_06735 [Rudanella paleaurantiibacter]|uniref:Uncharacterized protein n=2 Tax=Rudanella paleaurantiibacter TaxID=2614655 RepID=A0A7J5U350_9BACT|nr:hypothetical protein F5984_06735 [Rudanella paleaurantiibacter]